jgi:hypothetical protein
MVERGVEKPHIWLRDGWWKVTFNPPKPKRRGTNNDIAARMFVFSLDKHGRND